MATQGHCGNRQANQERIAKVQRRHRGVLVAKLVGGPDAAFTGGGVHGINKAKIKSLSVGSARKVRVAQQARWHARPGREDDESQQVAHGHGAATLLVEVGVVGVEDGAPVGGGDAGRLCGLHLSLRAGGCQVIQDNQKQDGAWHVDKRVDAVDPVHHRCALHKVLLDRHFDKDVQTLFEMDELQSMAAGSLDDRLVNNNQS